MSRHQKELTKKQKIIIYTSSATAAVAAAIAAVVAIVHIVNNPPSIIFNSNSSSFASNFSAFEGSSGILVPEATIIVTQEGENEKVADIVEAAESIKPTTKNKVVVKTSAVDTSALSKRQVKIPVKHLSQNPQLPTGCEITSLTTVLNYYGYDVTKTEMSDKYLEKTIDKIGNFWEIFVGNPRKNGFGCYAKPIVNAANRYLATQNNRYKAVDYSGTKFEDLLKLVENGTPVIIWSTMYGEEEKDLQEPFTTVQWTVKGKDIQWIAPEHCMVLIGYDLDRNVAILSDPQRDIVEYNLDTVKARYIAIHSQCVVLEELPVINGVQNKATYYTTQYVTVADYNLKSVTVNGEKSETAFLISGNVEKTYEIVATDADGHRTVFTVYTKPVLSMLDPLGNTGEFTVTADHLTTIEQIKTTALENSTRYSTPDESRALDEVLTFCDTLIHKINSVKSEFDRIEKAVSGYESKPIEVADTNELMILSDDINALMATSNLTVEQQTALAQLKQKCLLLLDNIPQTEQNIPQTE